MNQKDQVIQRLERARCFEHPSKIHRNCIRLGGLLTGKVSKEHQIEVNKLSLEAAIDGHHFLTEARLQDGSRIADFVDLDSNTVIEVAVTEGDDSLAEKEKFWVGLGFEFDVRRHVPETKVIFPPRKRTIQVPLPESSLKLEVTICSACFTPVRVHDQKCGFCEVEFAGEH